jgi:hypothetical protein
MAAIGDDAIATAAKSSPLGATYGQTVDSKSAYEILKEIETQAAANQPAEAGSKNAPAVEKPGWFKRFVNSRGFQTFLKALGTELIRGMFGGNRRRR